MAAATACTPSGRTVPARYPVQPSRKLPMPLRFFHPIARAVFALARHRTASRQKPPAVRAADTTGYSRSITPKTDTLLAMV